jgi:hypothetical protein
VELCSVSPQTLCPAYRLAYTDPDFLLRDGLRPVRLQLGSLKPELILNEHRIAGTIVIFGSARIQEPKNANAQQVIAEAALKEIPDDFHLQGKSTRRVAWLRVQNITTKFARSPRLFRKATKRRASSA